MRYECQACRYFWTTWKLLKAALEKANLPIEHENGRRQCPRCGLPEIVLQ